MADSKILNNDIVSVSTGKLGIGTSAPAVNLQVHTTGSGYAYTMYSNDTTGSTVGNGGLVGIGASEDLLIWNYEATPMLFATSGSEKMRITSAGNVGIGTTSPSSKLEVSGGSGAINGSGLAYLNNSDDAFSLVLDNAGTSSQNDRGVFEARVGGSSVFRINNSGNVGIGTTSPSEKLEVNGNVKADNFIGGNDAGIYSFNDTVTASTSEDIFSISNDHGAQAFRVTFVCNTTDYSVAKTYEVVHAFGKDPVFFKVVDTGAWTYSSADHDFDVTFATEAGGLEANNKKIICTITNNSATINADIVTTVFLGGSPTAITVTAL